MAPGWVGRSHQQQGESQKEMLVSATQSSARAGKAGAAEGLIPVRGANQRGVGLFRGRQGVQQALLPVGTHLADILCEAVPRARRPSTHRPKHSVTNGEFQSWSTGYDIKNPISTAQCGAGVQTESHQV